MIIGGELPPQAPHSDEKDHIDRHVAEGKLVLTVIGNDGVRWACETCNETVYERDGEWSHVDKRRDPCQSNTDCWGTCDRHSPLRPDHRTLPGKTPTDGAS